MCEGGALLFSFALLLSPSHVQLGGSTERHTDLEPASEGSSGFGRLLLCPQPSQQVQTDKEAWLKVIKVETVTEIKDVYKNNKDAV